jgi:hypothetical protein
MMSVDTDGDGAYLVEAPGFGTHAVSADGARITSLLAPGAPWAWQRLLVAQALPLAATLHGLEPLHASAVNLGDRAVAFTAPSGTGKTSIVMNLVARGAGLVTDDVLAIEPASHGLRAHPGARLMNADRDELNAIAEGRERLGPVLGVDEKVYLRPALEPRPLPLAALYRLLRAPAGAPFRIEEEVPPAPRSVLGTAFLRYLRSPDRLARRLELVSRVARTVRVFDVQVPPELTAAETAIRLERHAVCAFNVSPVPCSGRRLRS